ncbi:MAG TPA: toll/interleukin-1 receptor domain-containing protein [Terriglobales bacterium]|jgi:hypothetical protein|nr:toll/interleukin-1 receptor domain-containing protein [Terriglobales bacterium]
MAYVPGHEADVFISYAHADDFGWIERLKRELERALIWKLRASTKPEIFFDGEDLRAGRVFDRDIPECLKATRFFLAIITQRYNTSTYCRHKELAHFLKYSPPESGRTIQIQLDLSALLPLPQSLAVAFATAKGPFNPGSEEYKDSLRRVYEPIVHELDKLYAQSKMVFLAWPADADLQKERAHLQSEIEGRGLRIYPEAIAEYQDDIRLRDALQESAASVHFFGTGTDNFADRQFRLAVQVRRPTIVASRERAEHRRGPVGSPAPIWLDQGNPTIALANALDTVLGRSRREERNLGAGLGKTPLFLVFKPDVDHTLGLRLRQRIVTRGPFEVLEPRRDSPAGARYEELSRARAAVLCWEKAGKDWIDSEWDALNSATVSGQLYDMRRAIYLKLADPARRIEPIEGERILQSDAELDCFLSELQPKAEGAVA